MLDNPAMALLLSKAISWAEMQSDQLSHTGLSLNEAQTAIAYSVGVAHPELIRVLEVEALPIPDDADLRQAAQTFGLLSPDMAGLTMGHGIFIRRGQATIRLLSHEFRHVYQYEQASSIAACLLVYLQQIMTVGYQMAPLEIDARAHEIFPQLGVPVHFME